MTSQVVQRSGSARAVTGGSGANWLKYKYNVIRSIMVVKAENFLSQSVYVSYC